jgi:hypothetical protein
MVNVSSPYTTSCLCLLQETPATSGATLPPKTPTARLPFKKAYWPTPGRREILHAKETTMDQHFTKIRVVAGQEFADSLCHMLQADSHHGGVRLARILKRRQADQAVTLRSRIALIRDR